eukprot:g2.t1
MDLTYDTGGKTAEKKTSSGGGNAGQTVFMFNASKKEKYTAKSGFRKCFRKIRSMGFKTVENADPLCEELMNESSVFITASPREGYTDDDIAVLTKFVEGGGKLLVLANEGGVKDSNLNKLLKNYGIQINQDAVVRTVYYKYPHPKEVYISSGVLSKEFLRSAQIFRTAKEKKLSSMSSTGEMKMDVDDDKKEGQVPFVYPYGATLNLSGNALPLISSGFISFPMNRPIVAVSEATTAGSRGRLCVVGGAAMFSDRFLNKEQNGIVLEVIVQWLTKGDFTFFDGERETKAARSEITEVRQIPNTEALAERLRPCLEENEKLPRDFTKLFDTNMFSFGTGMVPEACKLYKQLDVKDEPLSLITPQFECPLPKLEPAVFPPSLREPPPPALDQFDLDEQFASERGRLAQLTNKCMSDRDIDYYVTESSEILNIAAELPEGSRGAKDVLEYVLRKLVDFKKLDRVGDTGRVGTSTSAGPLVTASSSSRDIPKSSFASKLDEIDREDEEASTPSKYSK